MATQDAQVFDCAGLGDSGGEDDCAGNPDCAGDCGIGGGGVMDQKAFDDSAGNWDS